MLIRPGRGAVKFFGGLRWGTAGLLPILGLRALWSVSVHFPRQFKHVAVLGAEIER